MAEKKPFEHIHKSKKVRKEVFDCVAPNDLPDGAYFAMADEFGLEPEDLIDNKQQSR